MELVRPAVVYKDSFIEALREYQHDNDFTHRSLAYKKLSVEDVEAAFESFVETELSYANGENLPDGYVPCTELWLVDNDVFLGRASIRHRLTEKLTRIGGHIGYDIRPSKRHLGYGNMILKLVLEKAQGLGLSRVLLTSDIRNVGSRKIIEKNGGVLENQIPNPEMGHDALRFWIEIK
ncbi:MAG: GCN5-related N-acetyltransferase [Candidatus Kaiserbacteria bacterium]|nr:GCN5-related N-acetyltransferase [Candidatus Kaiserbacteria bacterium]